jgi:hypothetical protein
MAMDCCAEQLEPCIKRTCEPSGAFGLALVKPLPLRAIPVPPTIVQLLPAGRMTKVLAASVGVSKLALLMVWPWAMPSSAMAKWPQVAMSW